jgi:hypothetical protein
MALAFYLLMMWVLGVAAWRILTRLDDRTEAIQSFKARPFYALFMICWLSGITAFVIGVFAPVIGEIEIVRGGLKVWQAGGLTALLGLVVSWKLD